MILVCCSLVVIIWLKPQKTKWSWETWLLIAMAEIPCLKALYLIWFLNGLKESADSSLSNGSRIYQDKKKFNQFWITEINAVKFCYCGHK